MRLRERYGWSQAELARRLGVSRHRLGKWELGLNPPSLDELMQLLDVLKVTFEELALGGAEPARPMPAAQRNEARRYLSAFLRTIKPFLEPPNGKP